MKIAVRFIQVGVILLVLSLTVTGCGTLHGVGRDIEYAGQAIQTAADE